MKERGLGDAALSGQILSVQSAASILSGLLGGTILGKLKKFSIPVIIACVGAAQLIVYGSTSAISIGAAAVLLGFFFAIRMPAGYLKATHSVPPAAATMAIAVYCSASQAGQFLSPLAVNAMGELLSLDLERKFLLGGVCLTVLAFLSLLWEFWLEKRENHS